MIILEEKILKDEKKLALFDYDGTIVDSAIMIVKGAIEAFRACGIPDPDPIKVKENIVLILVNGDNKKEYIEMQNKIENTNQM